MYKRLKSLQIGKNPYFTLLLVNFGVIFVSFATTSLLTKLISAEDFGEYRYVISLATLFASLFNLGFHYTAAAMLGKSEKNEFEPVLSTSLFMLIAISLIPMLLIFLVFVVFKLANLQIETSFLIASMIVFTLMIQRGIISIVRGTGELRLMMFQMLSPQLIVGCIYVISLIANHPFSVMDAVIAYAVSFLLTHIITYLKMSFSFRNITSVSIKKLVRENRTIGFQMYKGSLMGVAVNDVLNIIVTFFVIKEIFGYYSIAVSISSLMALIPSLFGVVNFRKTSSSRHIQRQIIINSILLTIITLVALNIGSYYLMPVLFYKKIKDSLPFVFILSIAYSFHGFGDFINNFFNSIGEGSIIKKSTYTSGIVQIIVALLLIPKFGIYGLLISRLLSSFVYFFSMALSYLKFRRMEKYGASA
jgi:O-antigen/teichoic acid export membrane protein